MEWNIDADVIFLHFWKKKKKEKKQLLTGPKMYFFVLN